MDSVEIQKSNSSENSLSARKWLIGITMFGMYASFGMSWMGIVPLTQDLEKALSIQHADFAWLISVISLAKSIFPIVAGILATRIGITSTLRLSSLLIVTAVITPWLPSYYVWIISRFLFGVGGAMWVTLMGPITMHVFDVKQRPIVNALNGVAVNFGVVLALWYTIPLAASFGWQTSLSFYSVLSGIFALLFWSFGEIVPKPAPKTDANTSENQEGYLSTLKMPVTWLISLAFTGPLALYLVFNTWLPIYYQEFLHIEKLVTLQWIIKMNVWGIPAAMATGFLVQYFKKCKSFILISAILLPISAFYAVNVSADNTDLLSIVLPLTGIGMFLSVSPLITLLQNQPGMNPKLLGMIMGTMFSVTYVLSAMVPGLIGKFYNMGFGLQTLLSIATLLALSPAIALVLKENN